MIETDFGRNLFFFACENGNEYTPISAVRDAGASDGLPTCLDWSRSLVLSRFALAFNHVTSSLRRFPDHIEEPMR